MIRLPLINFESISWKIDAYATAENPNGNDWISNCESQSKIYWIILRS